MLVDDFTGPTLDPGLWIDHYLPHWTTPDRSRARYDLGEGGLRLRIDADQPAWRPADGAMRVSNMQTGVHSGPAGSVAGTHRHRTDGLTVVSPQPTRRLWSATAGRVEVTASASADPTCMLGIWLVGLEAADPADSGELCIAELFGDRLGRSASVVRTGVKAHHDPRLTTDVSDVELPLDATRPHTYGVRWGPDGADFLVDGLAIKTTTQTLPYEQVLMIDLFEFPATDDRDPARYPKHAWIHRVALEAASAAGGAR